MHVPHNFLGSVSARVVDSQTVQITLVTLDPGSRRMVVQELALVAADPSSPSEVAQALVIGGRKLLERAGGLNRPVKGAPQGR